MTYFPRDSRCPLKAEKMASPAEGRRIKAVYSHKPLELRPEKLSPWQSCAASASRDHHFLACDRAGSSGLL
jgi:hypothetical protein